MLAKSWASKLPTIARGCRSIVCGRCALAAEFVSAHGTVRRQGRKSRLPAGLVFRWKATDASFRGLHASTNQTTGRPNLLDVAVVGAAAAAEHVEVGSGAAAGGTGGRARRGRRRRGPGLVQLGVAAPSRRWRAGRAPAHPGRARREHGVEVGGVRAVDHVVGRRPAVAASTASIASLQASAPVGSRPSVSSVNEIATGMRGLAAARDAEASALLVMVIARHHVGAGFAEGPICARVVGLGLVRGHDPPGIVAVAARTDAAADHHRRLRAPVTRRGARAISAMASCGSRRRASCGGVAELAPSRGCTARLGSRG